MAAEALQDIGYRVVIAYSAEEALERFEEAAGSGDGFKLVFTDVIMPGGANGITLAEQVRTRDPDVPVGGRPVEDTRRHEDAPRREPVHSGPALLAAGRPQVQPGLRVVDGEPGPHQRRPQRGPPGAVDGALGLGVMAGAMTHHHSPLETIYTLAGVAILALAHMLNRHRHEHAAD